MLSVGLLSMIAGVVLIVASRRLGEGHGPLSLVAALEASGLEPVSVPLGWAERLRRRGFLARAAVGARLLEARLDFDGPGRAPRVALQLSDIRLDPALSLQVHFGEQTHWVLGDDALAAALASERVRKAAGAGDQLHVAEGAIVLLSRDPAGAGRAVAALEEIADRLLREAGPDQTERLLEETALQDPCPRARADAATFLLARRPKLAERLVIDPAPAVRLAVARALGGAVGFELASEILTSEIFHGELQQAALRYLLSCHRAEQVGPVLVGALGAADDNLQGALVTALEALGVEEAVEALHFQLPTAELRNAARIAEALSRLEGSSAEPALVALLDRLPATGPELPDEHELAAVVADALGRVGTTACIPRLRRLAGMVPPEGPVGIATNVAIDLVRARTGALGLHGALAIAGASEVEGRLSDPRLGA